MRRIPVIFCTLVLIVTLVAWVDGIGTMTFVEYKPASGGSYYICSVAGKVQFGHSLWTYAGFGIYSSRIAADKEGLWINDPFSTTGFDLNRSTLTIPYWFIALAFGAYPVWLLQRRVRHGKLEPEPVEDNSE